jgi:hypothetical protein
MNVSVLTSLRVVWTFAGAHPVDIGADGVVELAWRGCHAELRGPRCVTEKDAELVLWTRRSDTSPVEATECDEALVIAGHGHSVTATGADDGGCWTRLKVEDPSGLVEVRGEDDQLVWSLPLVPVPDEDPFVTRARREFIAGDDGEAERLLRSAVTRLRAQGPSLDLARALDLKRRIASRSDRFDQVVESAEAARALYDSLGWISSACDITYALVNHHQWVARDEDSAREALMLAARCAAEIPRYAVNYRYIRARLMEGTADAYATWRAYQDIDVLARRLQDFDFEVAILAEQHAVAEQFYQREDLERIEQRLVALAAQLAGEPLCGLINALSNASWSLLMRGERGERGGDPRQLIGAGA